MKFPTLKQQDSQRQMIDAFKGYNHNLRINEGEFYDMKNLTSTYYPVLSPRSKRGVYETALDGIKYGLIAKDSLGYIENGEFYLNQYNTINLRLNPDADVSNTTITSMGAYVIIITRDDNNNILDKKWVNTSVEIGETVLDCGNIEATVETPKTTLTNEDGTTQTKYYTHFELCGLDEEYNNLYSGNNAPELSEAQKGGEEECPIWLDTSSKPYSLKKYLASQTMWSTVATTYIKISFEGTSDYFAEFEQYDGVTISGITEDSLSDLNNTMVIWEKGNNYIKVVGVFDGFYTQEDAAITIKRAMPDVDFITESENRLWGCRYGTATTYLNGISNTAVVNEIYACKLGDFKNWNCYMGLSTDSYAASVGTDGQFTGAITHLGYPLFFKENCLHKVYGNYPSNYQIQTTTCRGVQRGCSRSLAIVNETLYYKASSSICAYDGSLPSEISYALGDISYSNAVACSHGNKYYISMKDEADVYHLFVYDAAKGLWHKQDNTAVSTFCSCRGELYYIENSDNQIKTMFGSGTQDSSYVEWMAETGIIGTDSPDKKYISRLNVRMSLEVNTRVYIYVQYDSCGAWEQLAAIAGNNLRSFTVPIQPKRCDHLRLRIEGTGEAKIYSITKTIEEGSDI